MKIRTILPAVAATVLMTVAGAAAAEAQSSGAYGESAAQSRQDRRDDDRRDRRNRDRAVPSSSSTYGAGQVETSRDRSRATVVSGGEARGPGATSASSSVDAYGETTRDGSSADIFGGSTANANEPRRERRRPN